MAAYQPDTDAKYLAGEDEGLGRMLGGLMRDRPLLSLGAAVSLVVMTAVSANALMFQPERHPGPIYTTRAPIATEVPVVETAAVKTRPEIAAPVVDRTERELLRGLQQALADRGFYDGAVDGIAGSRTRAAIKAFQSKQSMDATGEASIALLMKVVETPMRRAAPVPAPSYASPVLPDRVETATAAGPDVSDNPDLVQAIQSGLKSYGYDELVVDGKMGTQTRSAIQRFELDYSLPITGVPNRRVLDKLQQIGALQAG